jgi:hypothetical protein
VSGDAHSLVMQLRTYVHCDVRGEITLSRGEETFRMLAREAAEGNVPRILLDLRGAEPAISGEDLEGLAEHLHELGLMPRVRVAILMAGSPERLRSVLYLQARAWGRGYSVRPFLNFEAAVDWLSEAT